MDTRVFCAYNLARGVFLSSKLTVAENANQPLKMLNVLVSGLALDGESGFWLTPLNGPPAIPKLFPFDLVYLDKDHRVVGTAEVAPGVEFPAYGGETASALLLPLHTMEETHTVCGDPLIVCAEEEMERLLAVADVPVAAVATVKGRTVALHGSMDSAIAQQVHLVAASKAGKNRGASLAAPVGKDLSALQDEKKIAVADTVTSPIETASASAKDLEEIHPEKLKKIRDTEAEKENLPKEPALAITEVVIAKPQTEQPKRIAEPQDGDDLFANWVSTPSQAPAWIDHKPDPLARRVEAAVFEATMAAQSAPAKAKVTAPAIENRIPEKGPEPATTGPEMQAAIVSATSANGNETAAAPETAAKIEEKKPEQAPKVKAKAAEAETASAEKSAEKRAGGPPRSTLPGRIAVPQTTAFTVAQYGMWSVSAPTAVNPVGTAKGNAAEKAADTPQGKTAQEAASAKKAGASSASSIPVKQNPAPASPPKMASKATLAGSAPVSPAGTGPAKGDGAIKPGPATGGAVIAAKKPGVAAKAPVEQNGNDRAASNGKAPEAILKTSQQAPLTAGPTVPAQPVKDKPARAVGIENLRTRFKRWLNPTAPPSDRRRAHRRYVPGMIAHYYTGGSPRPHDIADISMTGFYLLTEDRWMPDTMIQMTLQKPCAKGERKQSITVLSRIVRKGSDGVAAEFVMPESLDPYSHDVRPSQTTDRFALARFL